MPRASGKAKLRYGFRLVSVVTNNERRAEYAGVFSGLSDRHGIPTEAEARAANQRCE